VGSLTRGVAEGALLEVRAERSRLGSRPDPDAWRLAVEARRARPSALADTYLSMRLAEALLLTGERDEGRRELAAAHARAADLGARPLLDELERLATRHRIPLGEPDAGTGGPLTARELEVLALVSDGRTNREIGSALFITAKTVSVHVSNLLAKLGATNRTEAAAVARERGLLP
jgi:DNA-binding NarL/FixJ family response regulator